MNKKLFLGMFAAAGMLLATSCSNDELDVVQSGNEAQVSFSLGLEGGIATRAISDGTGADKLVYAVYKLNGQGEPELQKVVGSDDNGQFVKTDFKSGDNVSITLAKGQTYQVAFWAHDGDCKAYDTDDLTAVEVSYKAEDGTNAVNNDELRDAFFKMVEFEVAGNKTIDVVLKRPFAQINVGVESKDWEAAVASGIEIKQSAIVVKNAANTINLLTGAVLGEEEVTYALNTIPGEELKVDINNDGEKETYKWLSMSYILVADATEADVDGDGTLGDEKTTLNSLQFTFTPESGNAIEFNEGLNNVPVQRNWRTNILGKILTGDIQFNITIDPVYDGDIIYPSKAEEELEFAATFGGTVTLTEDVTLTEPLMVAADMVVNLNGYTITYTGDDVLFRVNGATVTINGTVEGSAIVTDPTTPGEGGNGYVGLVKDGGTLNINGGTYNGKQTCTIAQVSKGTLNVYGGTFCVSLDEWTDANGEARYLLNCSDTPYKNGEAVVNVYGGTFYKFNPANNAAEGTGTNFVAEGYKAVKSGDNYVVVAEEIQLVSTTAELQAAFENGGTVILADDVELTGVLTVKAGAEVYLDMNGKKMTVDAAADPAFYTYKGSTLVIDGNGTVELTDPALSLVVPGGDVVIENGTFVRNVPAGTPANQVGALFVGMKVSPWGSQTVTINGGYFDGGYYNADAADIEDILAGTKTFEETTDDIAKRGNSKDANKVRVALRQNVQLLLNLSSNLFKIYGGTFVGANPAWGDEGCMLPTSPKYLRPWSWYQGALLDGQTFNENGIVLPDGYAIANGTTEDGRPTYTVSYSK